MLILQNSPNIGRSVVLSIWLCALGICAASHVPAMAAQGGAMVAVNVNHAPTPPVKPIRPAVRQLTPEKPVIRYFIEFRSRMALSYGHAYVVYGRLDANGRMIDPHVGAIHPASNSVVPYMLGHLIPVPADHGASDGDLEEQYVSARYRIILNEPE
jgi:hypothetical protein